MNNIDLDDLKTYVELNIGNFHKSRLDSLRKLKFENILKRKNPYLYKAKNILISGDLVKILLDAHLSSQEEGIFGNFLEGLAIYICGKVYDGKKAGITGIDLDFNKDSKRYIVSIKSGPNWGNSRQIAGMKNDFSTAKRALRTSGHQEEIIAVNGCCYGRENKPDKGDYFKFCGQQFWTFISGDSNLYTDLIEPLGHKAKEKNEEFEIEHATILNIFTDEFSHKFCKESCLSRIHIPSSISAAQAAVGASPYRPLYNRGNLPVDSGQSRNRTVSSSTFQKCFSNCSELNI